MLTSIRTIRNIPRLRDISFVLVKHGLYQLAEYVGAPLRFRLRRFFPLVTRTSQVAQLRLAFQDLGPIFIKLGQLIANRPDLFPQPMVDEFLQLQDNVDPIPYEQIEAVITEALGGPTRVFFREVDPIPLAAASLAQVHRATTFDGDEVILKVQKPGLRKVMDSDLEILELVAQALAKIEGLGTFDPAGVVAEVRRSLERELNFNFERNAIERVRKSFGDDPAIVIPKIYPRLSTDRVLVQEFLVGRAITHCDPKELGMVETNRIAREYSRVLFQMIFRDGFFHADPHGSNILLLEGGKLGWIDFGSTGLFTDEMRHRLVMLLRALLTRDFRQTAREVVKLGRPIDEVHMFEFSQDLATRIDPYFGLTVEETNVPALLSTVLDLARDYRIVIPPSFVVMTRCLILMQGLTRRIAPEFDAAAELEPLVRAFMKDRYRPDRLAEEAWDEITDFVRSLREYPRQFSEILRKASEGRLKVDTGLKDLNKLQRTVDIGTNRLTLALVVSALLVSSSMVLNYDVGPQIAGVPALGLIGYLFSALVGLRIVFAMMKH